MDRLGYFIILLILVSSCAQVGTITGGDKDVFAPKPVEGKVSPPNESTNYHGNTLEITFNEYFRLSNPVANIVMVPPHARVKATVKKKTLLLSWDEELKENTTYAIYLNKAIKDYAEGNDSIMQFVFSTGPIIDTFSYRVTVLDAWTLNPEANVVVGIYAPDSNNLINFAQTNVQGVARLNYLSPGQYRVLAFKDENLDLTPQPYEKVGFPSGKLITINGDLTDSIPIRLFRSVPEQKIKKAQAISTGKVFASLRAPMKSAESLRVRMNDSESENYRIAGRDSLIILPSSAIDERIEIILRDSVFTDTVLVSRKSASTEAVFNLHEGKSMLKPGAPVILEANALIEDVDTSKIKIISDKDSVTLRGVKLEKHLDLLTLHLPTSVYGDFHLYIEEGAITTTIGTGKFTSLPLSLLEASDYGSIVLDLTDYNESLIVYCLVRGKVVRTIPVDDPSSPIIIESLLPGEYSFKVVVDENNNGVWDTGSLDSRTQPETTELYSEVTKVRANWDTSVKLTRTK